MESAIQIATTEKFVEIIAFYFVCPPLRSKFGTGLSKEHKSGKVLQGLLILEAKVSTGKKQLPLVPELCIC